MIKDLVSAEQDRMRSEAQREAAEKRLDHKLRELLLDQVWQLIHPEFNDQRYRVIKAPVQLVSDSSHHNTLIGGVALIGRSATHDLEFYSYKQEAMDRMRLERYREHDEWAYTYDSFREKVVEQVRENRHRGASTYRSIPYPLHGGLVLRVEASTRGGYVYALKRGPRDYEHFACPVEAVARLMKDLAQYLSH